MFPLTFFSINSNDQLVSLLLWVIDGNFKYVIFCVLFCYLIQFLKTKYKGNFIFKNIVMI